MAWLPNLVRFLHVALVLFMVTVPLAAHGLLLILAEAGYVLLFLHWFTNNDVCALTLLEQHLRGIEKSSSFVQSVVGPVYGLSNTNIGRCVWVVSVILFTIGLIRLSLRRDKPLSS